MASAASAVGAVGWGGAGGPAEARADAVRWPYERQLGAVSLHADFSLDPHGPLLEEIGQIHRHLARQLEIPAPREPVHLILFRLKTTYQEYLQTYYPRVPYRRALYIKDRGPGIVFAYRSAELDVDLRHETTHAVLHASLSGVPLWLDEGLAEYFEVPGDRRARGHEHLQPTRWQARQGSVVRLEELEALSQLDEMGHAEYQRAWAWVHFCLHGPPGARAELTRYLGDLQESTAGPPLSGRLRRHFPDLESRFVHHFRGWT